VYFTIPIQPSSIHLLRLHHRLQVSTYSD
jgi:hypothetical protein